MKFLIADNSDFIGIREIWESRFTTDKIYLDTLFKEIMPNCLHYVAKEGKQICSVISLMPMKLMEENFPTLNGYYMFGVATKEGLDGKGLASGLIKQAIEEAKRDSLDFIFERPANEGVTDFYIKLGFTITIPKIYNTFPQEINTPNAVLTHLQRHFSNRFEWENLENLQGLINLGEIAEHNRKSNSPTPIEKFIYLNNLKGVPDNRFSNIYFCFPME